MSVNAFYLRLSQCLYRLSSYFVGNSTVHLRNLPRSLFLYYIPKNTILSVGSKSLTLTADSMVKLQILFITLTLVPLTAQMYGL